MVLNPIQKQSGKRLYRPPQQGEWTYEDYLRLPANEFRYEVLNRELYMSPAPLIQHQRIICGNLRTAGASLCPLRRVSSW
jgi:hypothetical protein